MDYRQVASDIAARYNIPANLFQALITHESAWNPRARSKAGAIGLGQLMPATARSLGVDPFDPVQNLEGAAKYLSSQYGSFKSWDKALAAYNAGPGAVQKYGGIPPYAETQAYVNGILGDVPDLAKVAPPDRMVEPKNSALSGGVRSLPSQPQNARQRPSRAVLLQALQQASESGDYTGFYGLLKQSRQPLPVSKPTAVRGTKKSPTVDVDFQGQPVSPVVPSVLQLAKKYLGTPYKWGGASPKTGFDCSGFVQWLYGQKGVSIPRTTYQQIKVGQSVRPSELQAGDIIFFGSAKDPHHEGMYIGHGQFIHAPKTGDVIKISSLSDPYYQQHYVTARRVT